MNAAERAMPDALAAVATYGLAALWLTSASPAGLASQLAGLGAGTVVAAAAVGSILRRIPRFSTPADRVTLLRAVLVALCAALAVPQLFTAPRTDLLVPILGGIAYLLDGLDGAVARRTGTSSAEGARFDAATDGALVLVLSVAAAPVAGVWTLAIGGMYYVFTAVGFFRPHLRATLPPSLARKLMGAFQPFALLVAVFPGVPQTAAVAAPALALGLLVFSFTRDAVQLETRHRTALVGAGLTAP
ncbi:phosphatidylglycerophosphate synthase [Pseudarthrobacter defluvii]|uniref:CDP-alcohol phosphatidyltransferase family protein n=1 Tax=Pseudarthrobacter defluvii TaxID=410837 RepID=UPI002789C985|nr:CDP-alcohol phosphatidyltransferase family protein [Pseudarthrobacter defluvii]MDQ0767903.1 phosphatidylglycerophosphate synthase [Pseudarthrobacter defluvii]